MCERFYLSRPKSMTTLIFSIYCFVTKFLQSWTWLGCTCSQRPEVEVWHLGSYSKKNVSSRPVLAVILCSEMLSKKKKKRFPKPTSLRQQALTPQVRNLEVAELGREVSQDTQSGEPGLQEHSSDCQLTPRPSRPSHRVAVPSQQS